MTEDNNKKKKNANMKRIPWNKGKHKVYSKAQLKRMSRAQLIRYQKEPGGRLGKKMSEATKEQFIESIRKYYENHEGYWKNKTFTKKHRLKLSQAKKGKPSNRKGIGHTEESKRKLSLANKGRKLSDKTRAKISKGHKGMKFTEEWRRNLSIASKKRWDEYWKRKKKDSNN